MHKELQLMQLIVIESSAVLSSVARLKRRRIKNISIYAQKFSYIHVIVMPNFNSSSLRTVDW